MREVTLESGIEELKRRLEVLLGAKPDAAADESEEHRQRREAERLERRSRMAQAGGQLLSAAFTFLGEMIPKGEETEATARMARQLKERLDDCLDRDEHGHPRLTVTLPDEEALDKLSRSLAALLAEK